MATSTKVYLSNLNYLTTEDELRDFLSTTNASNVFIPNYFVGFGRYRFKPLGIAYADFPNEEEAANFISVYDGKLYKNRKLKARFHVPYEPKSSLSKLSRASSTKSLSKKTEHAVNSDHVNSHESPGEGIPSKEEIYSDSSVFVKGLRGKNIENDLREFFKQFNPIDIKVLRPKRWIRSFNHRSTNALVTFDLPSDTTVADVVKSTTGEKCGFSTVTVVKAFANKAQRSKVTTTTDNEVSEAAVESGEQSQTVTKEESAANTPEGVCCEGACDTTEPNLVTDEVTSNNSLVGEDAGSSASKSKPEKTPVSVTNTSVALNEETPPTEDAAPSTSGEGTDELLKEKTEK